MAIPITHYLITNRQIDFIDGKEVINPSGRKHAIDDARVSFRPLPPEYME